MGKCRFCGEDAGFLRRVHSECSRAYGEASTAIARRAAAAAFAPGVDAENLFTELREIGSKGGVEEEAIGALLVDGWEMAVGILTESSDRAREEENERRGWETFRSFRAAYDLPELDHTRWLTNMRLFRDRFDIHEISEFAAGQWADLTADLEGNFMEDATAAARAVDPEEQGPLLDDLEGQLSGSALSADQHQQVLAKAFEVAVDEALDDELLTQQATSAFERYLERFAEVLRLKEEDGQVVVKVDEGQGRSPLTSALTRLGKAEILRQVCEGNVPAPQFRAAEGSSLPAIPFNFQKSEQPVWIFGSADYYQMRTQRTYQGGSTGASIRVAKGVYLRQSAFRGHPVDVTETVMADSGVLAVTTKHIYFHGGQERFRVRYDKIVSFEPHDNGLGIMRDQARAKPETFVVGDGDGWFLYNLVTNLAQL